eukprot:4780487-Amphidinium_carterae.1
MQQVTTLCSRKVLNDLKPLVNSLSHFVSNPVIAQDSARDFIRRASSPREGRRAFNALQIYNDSTCKPEPLHLMRMRCCCLLCSPCHTIITI